MNQELADRLRRMVSEAQSEGADWVGVSLDTLLAIAECLDPEEMTDEPETDRGFN